MFRAIVLACLVLLSAHFAAARSQPVTIAWFNAPTIRATVHVTDVLEPAGGKGIPYGAADPKDRVSVTVTFRELASAGGRRLRLDPATTAAHCHVDAQMVWLTDTGSGVYRGILFRGRSYSDGLPNYYWCSVRHLGSDHPLARVPVVEPITFFAPAPGGFAFIGFNLATEFQTLSWRTLHDNTDRHFQFSNTAAAILTETLAAGNGRSRPRQ